MPPTRRALKRILVGSDLSGPSLAAVERAAMLAAEHAARLEILHVTSRLSVAPLKRSGPGRPPIPGSDPPTQQHLDRAAALVRTHGVEPTVKFVTGGSAALLAKEAERFDADLVVVGMPGKGSVREAVIGTTAERLVERARRNVLVVRTAPRSPYEGVLACVDISPMSASVVKSAAALSEQARLVVLHVYQPLFEMKLLTNHLSSDALAKHRSAARQAAAGAVAQLLRQSVTERRHPPDVILRSGNPPDVILGTAVKLSADVIVVGKNLSALEAFFLGSATKYVVRGATADVLVCAPG